MTAETRNLIRKLYPMVESLSETAHSLLCASTPANGHGCPCLVVDDIRRIRDLTDTLNTEFKMYLPEYDS